MNISLLDEGSRVVTHRLYFSRRYSKHHRNGVSVDCIRAALRRGALWIGRNLWKKPFVSMTACWRGSSTASSIPYHRLHRSMSGLLIAAPQRARPSSPEPSRLSLATYGEDTVVVKVAILGDCQTGKTSLMESYVVGEKSNQVVADIGVNTMDKVVDVYSAKIALSLWDTGGYRELMVPAVCKDAAAILILFDLTRRTTLHSAKEWFLIARQRNKVAVPVLVGTKFDQFIKLPESLKLLISEQAKLYAQAMDAPLLFTSVPYNINVHKVFKIVLARIFDVPCNISRNVTPGEPLVLY